MPVFKLALAQFNKGTKEPEYLTNVTQRSLDELDTLVPFVFKDRLFSCLSNFAYA